jgi:hypothetical protein
MSWIRVGDSLETLLTLFFDTLDKSDFSTVDTLQTQINTDLTVTFLGGMTEWSTEMNIIVQYSSPYI